MDKNRLSRTILYLTFCFTVFYPFKGIASFVLSSIAGQNFSWLINPLLFFLLLGFILLNLAANNFTMPSLTDLILLFGGFLGLAFGVVKGDNTLLYNTFLLFFLPVLLGSLRGIEDRYFYRTVYLFMAASTLYMLLENIILNPRIYGFSFKAPSFEQLCAYTNYLVWSRVDAGVVIYDYRHSGLTTRTGGYLGNVFPMPVLLALGATFFYVSLRETFRVTRLVFALLAVPLLVMSQSTTAIVAFIITIAFYECRMRKNYVGLFLVAGAVIVLISFGRMGPYVYRRLLTNLSDPQYVHMYLGYSVLLRPENILYLVWGKWGSVMPEGSGTHLDLINIIVTYGGVIAFLLYKRLLAPLFVLHRLPDSDIRIYSMMVLTAFICLIHNGMTLNVNVMLLVTLLYLKASVREESSVARSLTDYGKSA